MSMRFTKPVESWVVYQAVAKRGGGRAMCQADEWPALEAAGHTLIQAGLVNEQVAERLARGTSGDPKPRNGSRDAALVAAA
jgi:hypothetical protein